MKASLSLVLIWLCVCHSVTAGSGNRHGEYELQDLLPRMGDVEDWLPNGEPQFAVGEDLFLLINGGAEIYHEYGFKEVVFQTYGTEDGKSINLEIYKMDSQVAAYGIYTFKTGDDGNPFDVGYESWFESYYLNFWKGNYLVTITALDTDLATLDGVEKIAKAVDSKLQVESSRPHITSYLPKENLQPNGVTYLEGNLGLFNQYLFDEKDIFGLKEGVAGRYDNYVIFMFQYSDRDESKDRHEFAKNHLRQSERYEDFVDRDTQFEISDHRGNRLWIRQYHNWIVIILGDSDLSANRLLKSLEKTLTQ